MQQRYAVYHSSHSLHQKFPNGDRWAPCRDTDHFQCVAVVVASSVEEAVSLTKHGEKTSWTESPNVVWFSDRRVRSTTMGDVIAWGATENQARLVLRRGFEDISRVFATREVNGRYIIGEQSDKAYTLRIIPKRYAARCWLLSLQWSHTYYMDRGVITFSKDQITETQLREIASQFLSGKSRIVLTMEDNGEEEEESDDKMADTY